MHAARHHAAHVCRPYFVTLPQPESGRPPVQRRQAAARGVQVGGDRGQLGARGLRAGARVGRRARGRAALRRQRLALARPRLGLGLRARRPGVRRPRAASGARTGTSACAPASRSLPRALLRRAGRGRLPAGASWRGPTLSASTSAAYLRRAPSAAASTTLVASASTPFSSPAPPPGRAASRPAAGGLAAATKTRDAGGATTPCAPARAAHDAVAALRGSRSCAQAERARASDRQSIRAR